MIIFMNSGFYYESCGLMGCRLLVRSVFVLTLFKSSSGKLLLLLTEVQYVHTELLLHSQQHPRRNIFGSKAIREMREFASGTERQHGQQKGCRRP